MERWAFDTLGIEVTKDKKLIKKAYSALVKENHPEEHPDEWSKIHEAYQAALQYASKPDGGAADSDVFFESGYETGDSQEESEWECEEEIQQEDDYVRMFEAAQAKYTEERYQKAHMLARRLNELVHMPRARAENEWKRFFAAEFLPGVQPEELLMLLEAVRGNEIPVKAAKLIAATMIERKELYKSSMEFNKAALADGIINCIYGKVPGMEKTPEYRKKKAKRIVKEIFIGAGVGIFIIAVLILATAGEGIEQGKVIDMAVLQLNEKYGEGTYTEHDIDIEKEELYGSAAETLISYRVTEKEKESDDAVAYMLGEKADMENLLCFDRLQSAEIKQALQADINERTGRPEGRVFWDSAGGGAECLRDGYFHEKYESGINEFLKLEAQARETAAGLEEIVDGSYFAKNGNADYYIPDKDIQTVKQRLALDEKEKDETFTAILGQCAADYDMQVCGIVLPGMLFEEKMKQADWNEGGIAAKSRNYYPEMYPPVSFALMTGWYVCLPPYGQKYLRMKNGMYSAKPVHLAEGVWGAKNEVSRKIGTDLTGRLKTVKTPKSLGVSEAKGQKSVSFRLTEGVELEESYCLVIDKTAYNIPDSGYQVILTTYWFGEEDTSERPPMPYSEPDRDVRDGDSLDGEGYLFVKYPKVREDEKTPVITIIY